MIKRGSKLSMALGIMVCLSGCAGLARMNTYTDEDGRASVHVGRAEYKISVHPTDETVLIQEALGGALGGSIIEGLTFGAADTSPPLPVPRLAAAAFLSEFGCGVGQIYPIEDITSEATFTCPDGVRPLSHASINLCTDDDPYGPVWQRPADIDVRECR